MSQDARAVWTFGEFRFDIGASELVRNKEPVKAEPQTLRVLEYLIRHRDRVVSREDLIREIWEARAISDWAVSAAIKAVRASLGDTGRDKAYVRTVHSRGFRFIAPVREQSRPNLLATEGATVLVRAFRPSPPEPQHVYLAEGLTEDLITDLSRRPELSVLSLNATRAVGPGVPSSELGVRHIVEGSVRQLESVIRINLSVLDGLGQRQVWAERFDFDRSALVAAQDQISARVAGVLVPGASQQQHRAGGTRNSEAYDAYLKGRYAYFRYDPKAFVEALAQFEKATEIDPEFADAFAQQAYCRTTLFVFGLPGADETLAAAEALARKAIALEPGSALAHARLGWTLGYGGVLEPVLAAFKTALACDPENAEVALAFGETLNRLAQPARAQTVLESAFGRDMYFPPSWEFAKGHSKLLLGDGEGAIAHFRSVLSRVERFVPARVQLIRALSEAEQADLAREEVDALRALAPRFSRAHARRMFPYPDPTVRQALDAALEEAGLG